MKNYFKFVNASAPQQTPPAARIFHWVLDCPLKALSICTLLFLIACLGFLGFSFTTDYRYFFSDQNPDLRAFNQFQQRFGKSDHILVVVKPAGKTVFEPRALAMLEELTARSWETPHSTRVDSLTNFQHIQVNDSDILVEPLFDNALALPVAAIATKTQYAISEPALQGFLISEDQTHSAIFIHIETPEIDNGSAQFEAVDFVDALVDDFKTRYPNANFYVTGQLKINAGFMDAALLDATTLIPLMFLLLTVFLWLFLRSFHAMLATMLIVIMSSGIGVSLAFALGIPMSAVATSAPLIILTLAVADCVHILVSYRQELRSGQDQYEALYKSLAINLQPVFLTSLTTIIGFLSLNFNESPPVQDMGNMVAIGVAAAFMLSLSFLPAYMMLCKAPSFTSYSLTSPSTTFTSSTTSAPETSTHWSQTLANGVTRYGHLSGALVLLLSAVLAWQASRNELNDMLFEFLSEKLQVRQEINYVKEHMTGVMSLSYSVSSPHANGVTQPDYLKTLARFKDWLQLQPEVKHVNAFSDVIQRINRMLHDDDVAFAVIPDDPAMISQNLLLYEMSLPFGMSLDNQVDFNKQTSHLRIQLDNLKTKQLIAFVQRAEHWLASEAPAGFVATPTGPDYMFARITFRTIKSMAFGTLLAIGLISLCMMIALKDWKLGLISFVPNILPLFMTFGVWGVLVGEVGLIASSVAVIGLGLIIDDTVHFLSKYQRARLTLNYAFEAAIDYAFSRVASAILVTSVILMTGFAILGQSAFKPNTQMGILTSITIGFALLSTFFLLPAMLQWFDSRKHQDSKPRPVALRRTASR